jgi:hypothetical protein
MNLVVLRRHFDDASVDLVRRSSFFAVEKR